MKKIEITTFNRAFNYGALLQLYALSKYLSKKDDTYVEALDYRCEKIENNYLPLNLKVNGIKNKIKNIIKFILLHKILNKKYNSFSKFIKNNIKFSASIYSKDEIRDKCKDVNVFITGSDQVWNKNMVGELSDIYTLNFDYPKAKKISYAASVGDNSLIAKNKDEYISKISQIDYISVREEDTRNELVKVIDNNINVVLDPTLLLKKDEWEKVISHLNKEKEKYIFAYVVTPDDEYIRIVKDLSEKTDLPVVFCGIKNPGFKKTLKTMYTEGPLEFVNYIKNAEYIVTTSFHATVFSIIFNKKFFIIPHSKTGARVTNLLDKLGIKGRSFKTYEEYKNTNYNIETNWTEVNKKLNEEREKSMKWLNNALED